MSSDRIIAGRAAILHWFAEEVEAQAGETRAVLQPLVAPGERLRAELPDGTVIGAVTIGVAGQHPTVTDARALLTWVKAHCPTEIEESVRESFLKHLKAQVRKHGYAFDKVTGEVIPGIELQEGSPSYRPTVDKAQLPLLRSRFSEIIGQVLLELPAKRDEATS
jgi:hypothetical protein